jgi:hypothetical protein
VASPAAGARRFTLSEKEGRAFAVFDWLVQLFDRLTWRIDPGRFGAQRQDPHFLRSRMKRIAVNYWWRLRNAWYRMFRRL